MESNIKHLAELPLVSYMDDNEFQVNVFSAETNICEMFEAPRPDDCSNDALTASASQNGMFFGTDDSHEPKFCAKHYFGSVNDGDGKSNYALKFGQAE